MDFIFDFILILLMQIIGFIFCFLLSLLDD